MRGEGTEVENTPLKFEEKYEEEHKAYGEKVYTALINEDMQGFRDTFLEMHPYDQAEFFIDQEKEQRITIYSYLSPDEAAEVMINIVVEDAKPYLL